MCKIIFIVIILLYSVSIQARQNLTDLLEPPLDSANMVDMKIWVPIEQNGRYRVKIEIYDQTNKLIRNLMNEILPKGYHNFYWDKKDARNKLVKEGEYLCKIKISSEKKTREKKLIVKYAPGERDIIINPGKDLTDPYFDIIIMTDSIFLSLNSLNRRGKVGKSVFFDSLFYKGEYRYNCPLGKTVQKKEYRFKLTANNFPHKIKLRYQK